MELFVVVVTAAAGLTVRFVFSTLEMSVPVKNEKIIFQALRGNILENAVLYRQQCNASEATYTQSLCEKKKKEQRE